MVKSSLRGPRTEGIMLGAVKRRKKQEGDKLEGVGSGTETMGRTQGSRVSLLGKMINKILGA